MIFICGDSSVGKTSLRQRWASNYFEEMYIPTLGMDFGQCKISFLINNSEHKLNLQIWDFSGHERFRNLLSNYLAGIKFLLIMFDYSNRISFNNIHGWLSLLAKQINLLEKHIIIIGNKVDLKNNSSNSISFTEAQEMIRDLEEKYLYNERKILFFETSAKTGENINEVLKMLAEISTI